MIQRRKAKIKKTWKECLFSLTFSNDEFHLLFTTLFYFLFFSREKKKRVLMLNSTTKIVDFDVNKFNLIMKVSLMCFLPLKLPKKKNQTLKRILFLVSICGYRRVSREVVLLIYLYYGNIFRCFGAKN